MSWADVYAGAVPLATERDIAWLRFGREIGAGRNYTTHAAEPVYLGTLAARGRLVVKLHRGEATAEMACEAWVYEHRLGGRAIAPAWHGIFGARRKETIVAAVMGDAGPMQEGLGDVLGACVLGAYRHLHAVGVVHNSAKPKHWRWDGGVRLIDFGTSVLLEGGVPDLLGRVGEAEFEALAAEEMEGVREALRGMD
jgi:hypothetical protein